MKIDIPNGTYPDHELTSQQLQNLQGDLANQKPINVLEGKDMQVSLVARRLGYDAAALQALNKGYNDFLDQKSTPYVPLQQVSPKLPDNIQLAKRLLQPPGWKILVVMYRAPEKIGSLFTPESTQSDETVASMLCRVVTVGPMCYKDEKYLGTAWCKEGDIALMKTYAGIRLKIGDDEYRLINEDSIDGIITDESQLHLISRAY